MFLCVKMRHDAPTNPIYSWVTAVCAQKHPKTPRAWPKWIEVGAHLFECHLPTPPTTATPVIFTPALLYSSSL